MLDDSDGAFAPRECASDDTMRRSRRRRRRAAWDGGPFASVVQACVVLSTSLLMPTVLQRPRLACSAPPSRLRCRAQQPLSPAEAASGAVKLCSLASLLALAVVSEAPPVLQLDAAVHTFVREHSSVESRRFAQTTLSNAPPVAGALLCAVTGARLCFAGQPLRRVANSRAVLLLSTAFVLSFGEMIPKDDEGILLSLKTLVHRARPTELGASLSFPSGHSAVSAFIWTALVTTLLPRTGRSADWWLPALVAVVLTVAGRTLADVHWLSDCLAGALLGAGVSLGTTAVVLASDAHEESTKSEAESSAE